MSVVLYGLIRKLLIVILCLFEGFFVRYIVFRMVYMVDRFLVGFVW